jgi:uncharacterized protein
MNLDRLNLTPTIIQTFCQKWNIIEFLVFGSALRDDFRPDSDLDILVNFAPNSPWTILDLATMQQELEELSDRPVDLIEKRVIENSRNWIRRNEILNTAQVVYSQIQQQTYELA